MQEWNLSDASTRTMTLGYWLLLGIGVLLHWALWGQAADWPQSLLGWGAAVGIVLGLSVLFMVLHEGVHGLALLLLGARPSFGAGTSADGIPYLFAGAPGKVFSRAQFGFVLLAPLVLLGGFLAVWTSVGVWGSWLIIPAGVHLGGCIGDLVMLSVLARQPAGTRVEDTATGMAFHPAQG